MVLSWEELLKAFDGVFPEGSPRRKLLMIVSIILLFEGISVFILFSKAGRAAGIFSLALGIFVLLLLFPGSKRASKPAAESAQGASVEPPPGIKLIDAIVNWVGNDYMIMAAGAAIITLDVVWNLYISPRPSFGDLDTLSIVFGGMIMVFPFVVKKFKIEACFSLLFIGLVVLFLVIPQTVALIHKESGSSIGNWYVQYMLAAPFAGILNLIGIPASSSGSIVIMHLRDGSPLALNISAYCAGLYSFSIFLAAFCSFVLVFERLKNRLLITVLAIGLLVAFLGNIFRMVIIGIVGYYRGLDSLIWAHHNVGWIVFLSWSAIFWYFLLGYVSKHSSTAVPPR